jgi:hypothetical protein
LNCVSEKTETDFGLIFADSFVDAVRTLEERIYGEDLTKINELELFDTVPHFSKEVYTLLKKELNEN